MRSSSSLLGRIFMGIASEMLEILTKILNKIFNYNLFPCDPWIKSFCDFRDFCVTLKREGTCKRKSV